MVVENEFLVKITDVNQNNIVKPQTILRGMQEVACIHSNLVQDGLYYLEKTGGIWVILSWKLKILEDLKWNDKMIAKTWSRKMEKIYAYRDFEADDTHGKKIAIATSKWTFINLSTKSIGKPPEGLLDRYQSEDIRVFSEEPEKLKEPEEKEFVYTYTIQKRDLDTNGHVNNCSYVDFAMEVIEDEKRIDEIYVEYKKECKLGDVIDCFITHVGEKESILTIKNKSLDKTSAIVKVIWR